MRSSSYCSASSIDPNEVGEYLTNSVSRSIVYTLLLSQPLTREEIEKSPVRASMRAISYRSSRPERDSEENVKLRTLLSKGVSSGMLFAYKSGGRNYYFLNSDLMLTPKPIGGRKERGKGNQSMRMDVKLEEGVGEIMGEVVLPPNTRAASSHAMPIPQIDSEKRLILWLSWLTTPARREILRAIAHEESVSRPVLRKRLGFWADRLVMNEGIPTGILAIDGKNISFQFSSLQITGEGSDKGKGDAIKWIENPPSFMLSRSFEPLRCVHGSSAAIEELKMAKTSPMRALKELESAGRKIISKNRKKSLSANFFEFATLFGTFDSLPRLPITRASVPLLLPDNISLNDKSAPIVWVKETKEQMAISRTQFAVEASRIFAARKAETERIAEIEQLMRKIARERIQEHLEKVENRISETQLRSRSTGLALGKDSIAAFATLEIQKEELLNEKKYAEKFFDMIFGSHQR